ncbi:MAG: NAD-dependent epimerase/dehydratase family protein [Polyangiaceae bacterium]
MSAYNNGSSVAESTSSGASRKKLWVGGATGFLGTHLVHVLRERGHELVLASRSGGEVAGLPVQAVDVLDSAAVAESARGCEGAFLATGKVSRDRDAGEELHRAHVLATRAALAGLRSAGVRRVVVASTSGTLAVSGNADQIADESASAPLELVALWPYYRSKLYAEREALDANSAELEVVLVNPSLLLGPGDTRESSTGDVRRFLERSIPAIPGGGIAFVDVRDAALGMWQAFEHGRAGERYILNAKNMTVAAFFQRLERVSGVKAPVLRMPRSRPIAIGVNRLFSQALRAIGGQPPVDEVSVEMAQYFWYCSSSKAERELGFSARDPGETLRETVADLVARKVVFPKRSDGAVGFVG